MKGLISTTALILALAGGALAQVPVFDAAALTRQIQQLQHMIEDAGLQSQQLTTLMQQLEAAQAELDKLNDLYDMLSDPQEVLALALDIDGADLNAVLDGDFLSLLDVFASGASGGWGGVADGSRERFEAAVTRVLSSAGLTQDQLTAMAESDNENAQANAQKTAQSAATSAAAELAYDEAGELVQRTSILVAEIAELDGLKASVDHNTRVTAELAIALAAMWQLEAVQTVNTGMGGVTDAATLARVERFLDFTLPDIEIGE